MNKTFHSIYHNPSHYFTYPYPDNHISLFRVLFKNREHQECAILDYEENLKEKRSENLETKDLTRAE